MIKPELSKDTQLETSAYLNGKQESLTAYYIRKNLVEII